VALPPIVSASKSCPHHVRKPHRTRERPAPEGTGLKSRRLAPRSCRTAPYGRSCQGVRAPLCCVASACRPLLAQLPLRLPRNRRQGVQHVAQRPACTISVASLYPGAHGSPCGLVAGVAASVGHCGGPSASSTTASARIIASSNSLSSITALPSPPAPAARQHRETGTATPGARQGRAADRSTRPVPCRSRPRCSARCADRCPSPQWCGTRQDGSAATFRPGASGRAPPRPVSAGLFVEELADRDDEPGCADTLGYPLEARRQIDFAPTKRPRLAIRRHLRLDRHATCRRRRSGLGAAFGDRRARPPLTWNGTP
jgi:hypothetical protein